MFEASGGNKAIEIMAKSLMKGIGITPEWMQEQMTTFLALVKDIRDNSAAARVAAETAVQQNADILEILKGHSNGQLENTDRARIEGGRTGDPNG